MIARWKITAFTYYGLACAIVTILVFPTCRKSFDQVNTTIPRSGARIDTIFISNVSGSIPNSSARLYVQDTLYTATFINISKIVGTLYTNVVPVSAYFSPEVGITNLKLVTASPGVNPPAVADPSLTKLSMRIAPLAAGGNVHVIVYDTLPGVAAYKTVYENDPSVTPPSPRKFKLRIANFNAIAGRTSYQPFTTSLLFRDGQPVDGLQQIPYRTITDYVELDYDSYQFNVLTEETGALATNFDQFKQIGWRPSYFFRPGGVYTLLVKNYNGFPVYDLITEQSPVTPVTGPVGKVQFINCDPALTDVVASYGDGVNSGSDTLLFGVGSAPHIVKSGTLSFQFLKSSTGSIITSGQQLISPLGNVCIYLLPAVTGKPRVLIIPQRIISDDYTFLYCSGDRALKEVEQAHLYFLNLCPDVALVSFLPIDKNGVESIRQATDSVPYSKYTLNGPPFIRVGTFGTASMITLCRYNFNNYPIAIRCREYLGGKSANAGLPINVIATQGGASPINNRPGDYTVALVGSYSAPDLARRPRLIVIRNNHTNHEF